MKTMAAALLASAVGLSSAVADASSLSASKSSAHASAGVSRRIDGWEQLVSRLRNVPRHEHVKEVNEFFNRMHFQSDQKIWGKEDYWASPTEFLTRGAGDCEDYAIAKYISLRRLGVDDSRLRLAYVRSLTLQQAHMVLLVETENGEQVVLDNLTNAMQSPTRRGDLEPVYSFNGTGLWLLDKQYNERKIGLSSRLTHWVALQDKSANSGIWPENNR